MPALERRLSASERGYTWRWHKARNAYLKANPLCVMCQRQGLHKQAKVVDHIIPHKGDQILFWDQNNWQPLCKQHHDAAKQSEERLGYSKEVGADGWPIDPKHPSNRGRGGLKSSKVFDAKPAPYLRCANRPRKR